MPKGNLTTAQAGYGTRHRAERKRVARLVKAGGVICWRCGREIYPDEPWDLGHVDGSRTRYAGPEHRRCNRSTARHMRRRVSRPW